MTKIFASNKGVKHFNPHEREARDSDGDLVCQECLILIHTSVKLVTLNVRLEPELVKF